MGRSSVVYSSPDEDKIVSVVAGPEGGAWLSFFFSTSLAGPTQATFNGFFSGIKCYCEHP
jgi:hypothetical protein